MVSKGAPSVLIYGSPLLVDAPLTLDLGSVPPKELVILYSLLVQEQPQARAHLRLQSGTQTYIRVLSGHFTPKTW